jgi:hypothetical protein
MIVYNDIGLGQSLAVALIINKYILYIETTYTLES